MSCADSPRGCVFLHSRITIQGVLNCYTLSMATYEDVLKDAEASEHVLGFILTGSRGKGFENEHSDYDAVMVVADENVKTLQDKYEALTLENIDLSVWSLTDFKKYADWDSTGSSWWDRYDYAHVKILVDKTDGELEKIVREKGYIPPEKQKAFTDRWLDGYVNGVFRSVKCIRNGNKSGAHLEAVHSILDLLTAVFAMNGRHRPFLSYVEKELQSYPLEHLPWSSDEFVAKIQKVLETADLETQQELLRGVENMGREMGYGQVFDDWEGKDKWTMTYSPEQ